MSAIVPLPDADGFWHYTYVTYHPDTFEWYGGKHTTANLKDGYLGSGNWIKNHPARGELLIDIVEFFFSEEHAYAAEVALVNFDIIQTDSFCRNETDGGFGFTRDVARRLKAHPKWRQKNSEKNSRLPTNPEWLRKIREAAARRTTDLEWRRKNREANVKLAADPEWRHKHQLAVLRNKADPEWLRKNREANARLAADPEWLRKNREVGVRNSANQQRQQKLRDLAIQRSADPEYRRKNLEVGARNAADPEWRRKISNGMNRYHENGGTNSNAKLTAEQVIAIRKSGETTAVAASRYGVSCSAIQRIRNRLSWSNLP